MYTPTFSSVWAKVLRFKEHRDALHLLTEQTTIAPANRATLGLRYDAQSDEWVLYVTHPPDLEETFHRASIILGDAVHNLRSALDHTSYELALWHTGGSLKRPRSVMFPIVGGPGYQKTPEELWKDAVARWMREIHGNHRAVIQGLQAHKRPDAVPHPLLMLRDLDDTDKHRLLNVVVFPASGLLNPSPAAMLVFILQLLTGGLEAFAPVRVELGAEVFRARVPMPAGWRHVDMDMAGYMAPQIAFEDGLEVVSTLDWLGSSVAKVIAKFLPLTHG